MTDLEKRIYEVIAKYNGVSAADIAVILNMPKSTVNTTLSRSAALQTLVRQAPNYKWYQIAPNRTDEQKANKPKPDEDLRNLCNYYLQCISLEDSSSVSQYLESRYKKYEYAVLNSLSVNAFSDTDAIALLNKINGSRDKKAYLGYPIRIYTVYGKGGVPIKRIAPVFLFPIDYEHGVVEVSPTSSINIEVLKGYCDGSTEAVVDELLDLEGELGMNDPEFSAGADDLVLRLIQVRDWNWKEQIDPYAIPKTTDITGLSDGIYNRPVVIIGDKGQFTAGLESELIALSDMPEDGYKDTALYAWIKNGFQNQPEIPKEQQILEVLPLNTEQSHAIETALNSDLTIVTGPPGTGKSQVVTDLLTNIAKAGKRALFSSRNNKAVDVVDKRVNGLSAKPVLLRIGSNQYASRLAEIVEGFITTPVLAEDYTDLQNYEHQNNSLITEENTLKARKDQVLRERNQLDEAEKQFCRYRDIMSEHLFSIKEADGRDVKNSADEYIRAESRAIKENNGFFARLFWGSVGNRRRAELEAAKNTYNEQAARYGLPLAGESDSDETIQMILTKAARFKEAIPIAVSYRNALKASQTGTRLEDIDRELTGIKTKRADLAMMLWDKWLKAGNKAISDQDRREMGSFVAAMKLSNSADLQDDAGLKKQYSRMIRLMTEYLQCWAVTSLSAKSRIPFEAGLFDYVIIDEASQCDIASIIPLLYRAKRAVIIGDPKQLQHISSLSKRQDAGLLKKYRIDPVWSYSVNSVYALATTKVKSGDIIQLRDHFRSCAEIIEFSNDEFYDGTLRPATDYGKLRCPPGEKPGIRWIDVKGHTVRPSNGSAYNAEEITQVISELRRLVKSGYRGTIGVTTPFRIQAERIRQAVDREPELAAALDRYNEFLVNTVHSFQGDERDLMIFSSVVTHDASGGTVGFLNSTGNLFNVAITRARAVLVVVGDYRYCSSSEIKYLNDFAAYYRNLTRRTPQQPITKTDAYGREYPFVSNPEQVSEWEKILYTALYDAGIHTIPQQPADRYRLDLAIIQPNGRKLDIEIDGEMYHRSWNGELSYRDQLRNQRMFELGWDVRRFWVYQIRDDIEWCVQQVKKWCDESDYS